MAQHHDGDADDDKSKQGTNVHHFADVIDRSDAANDGGEQAGENGSLPWGAEARVNIAEELARQQAVVGHGVEDATLAEQHDEHDTGEAGDGADGNDR